MAHCQTMGFHWKHGSQCEKEQFSVKKGLFRVKKHLLGVNRIISQCEDEKRSVKRARFTPKIIQEAGANDQLAQSWLWDEIYYALYDLCYVLCILLKIRYKIICYVFSLKNQTSYTRIHFLYCSTVFHVNVHFDPNFMIYYSRLHMLYYIRVTQ